MTVSSAGKQDEALDNVAEFADIAGPGVAAEFSDGFVGKEFFLPAVLLGDLAGEMSDEFGKIFGPLAQRRKGKRKNDRRGGRGRGEIRFS